MANETKHETKHDTSSTPLFGDLSKMLEQYKMPGFDMGSLVAANQAAYAAMQSLAKTQTDMVTQAMQSMQTAAQGMAGSATAGDPGKQADAARQAWQKMLTDMQGLAEMARKSQVDAVAGMTARAGESMQAVQKVVQQAMLPK